MQKIIFTNSNDVTFESDKINKMFENGLDILHIRKSEYTEEKLRRYINNIDKKYHSKIVIHEFFNLLDEYDLKGIHINRENRNSFWFNFFTLKRIKSKHNNISISYSVDNIKELNKISSRKPSYVFMGRIFSAHTTNRLTLQFNKEELIPVNSNSNFPIIALGGIDEVTSYKYIQLGFGGIALQSHIWNSTESVNTFKGIIDILEGRDLVQIAKHA